MNSSSLLPVDHVVHATPLTSTCSSDDQNNTPTIPHPPTLPQPYNQVSSWPVSLPSAFSSASAYSSASSSSSYCSSSTSTSSASSPSSSSSSPPLCRHLHPLEPDISTYSSSSSPLCLSAPPPKFIASAPKPTRPCFLLPGPALCHLTSPLTPQPFQLLNPPPNFATVAPGLFRSSFPQPENFEFLAKLKLRTILTLVQEPYPLALVKHYERVGIKLIQYPIPGNKEPFVHIPEDKIRLALRQVLDIRNQPMLIHCNKGKHRTGCLVGCLRKLQHWSSTAIFDEYRRYAFPKSRNMDQQFIELFDHSPVWEEVDPEFAPQWLDLTM